MKRKGLLKIIIGVTLVTTLAVGLPSVGCAPPEAAPEVAEPIIVGAGLPLTGSRAPDGLGYRRATEFAVDHLNRAGGVLGRPLQVELFDTQDLSLERLKLAADTLVGQNGSAMVIGGWSGWGQDDVEAYGKYDAPFFCWDGSEMTRDAICSDIERNHNIFMATSTENASAKLFWQFMMHLPYDYPNNKVALIGSDDSWGRLVVEGIRDEAEAAGWEVPIFEIVPYGTTDWGGILSKVRAEEPAWLHIEIVFAQDVVTFFQQFIEDPTNTLLQYGYSMNSPEFMEIMGEGANGIMGMSGGFIEVPPETEEVAAWLEEFEATYGDPPSAGAPSMYNCVLHWAAAVEAVGSATDYHAITDWIANNPFSAMPGFPMTDFDECHKVGMVAIPGTMVQVQNGEWHTLYDNVTWEPYVDYQGNTYEFQVPWWVE